VDLHITTHGKSHALHVVTLSNGKGSFYVSGMYADRNID
jgi:hypothetical protein